MRDLIGQAVHLDLHGGTPYPQALGLPISYLKAYFDSAVFTQQVKSKEAEQKLDLAVIGRLDVVIKAISGLAKSLVRR